MKQFIIIILLILVLPGCSKELKVNFEEPSKKIVLYPFLTNDKKITIKMSAPTGILSEKFPVLDNASVVITDNGIAVDTVAINAVGNGYSKIIPVTGHEYSFRATATGYPEAVCTAELPQPVEGLSVDTTYLSVSYTPFMRARLRFRDDPDKINYYRVTVLRKGVFALRTYRIENSKVITYDSTVTRIWKPRILANNPVIDFFSVVVGNRFLLAREEINFGDGSGYRYELGHEIYYDGREYYFPDDLFKGKEIVLDLIVEEIGTSYFPEKYMIELSSVSEDYYMGLKSYARYGTKEQANLPVSEEVSIYSAVKGGYGFPVAFNTVIDSSYWMKHN